MNAKFKLELEHLKDDGETVEKETVEVTMQETSPVIMGDIFSGNLSRNGSALVGSTVEACIGTIIMSPKNLMDRIAECDNQIVALAKVYKEVNQFCAAPKKYVLLQRKSEQESSTVGEGTPQPDTNGTEQSK